VRELNGLMAFLRDRANEDLISGDEERRARGRTVFMIAGLVANAPERFGGELRWLAGHYSGYPEYGLAPEKRLGRVPGGSAVPRPR
jgi:hypothetical protein